MIHFVVLLLLETCVSRVSSVRFDAEHSQVNYSGIASGITLPVYYFQLNLFDKNGEQLDESPENNPNVEVLGADGSQIRSKVELLDTKNGRFMGRIKTFQLLEKVTIRVTDEDSGKEFGNSRRRFENLNHDECSCPVEIERFQEAFELEHREDDVLIGFDQMSYESNNEQIREYFAARPNSCALCHYVIKAGRIYRQCYGKHVGFNMFSDATLIALSRIVKLPDVQFWMNLGDWPHSTVNKKRKEEQLFQMVSWGSHQDFKDLVVPTYDLMDSTLGMMHRLSKDQFSVQSTGRQTQWTEKIEKGFFRGRDSRQERLDLAEMSQKNPELIDAAITRYFFFKEDESKYGPRSEHVPFADHFKFKYQINVDGTVAAYRLPYLILGNSVVLKQESAYYEHFYPKLEAWKHFIPLKRDLSDIVEKIQWAKENDAEVAEIARAAHRVVEKETEPVRVLWSWISLLKRISEKMTGEVEINDEMEEVQIPVSHRPCSCSSRQHNEL
ncbi:Oidioi.mRNA.OKI2018_I69.XSR.g16412.t1.cds [Oikopleura dioica]|uniref:Oidioi.mRNA.OKI2018_I69.XSR.g16412.t1.cds n=1 Tax=Oikopleura dioica TaxID=34765 RepID=A0ABN7SKW0_OIKDI|nr:Oidioi.mRNA.OKI2018_I69.XSR.g16412.t1.cds [Oikopleura dioica]